VADPWKYATPQVFSYQISSLQVKHFGRRLIPYKHASALTVLPHQISSLYIKPSDRNYQNPPENFDPMCPAFQGHFRTLEPTQINRLYWFLISNPY